MSAGAATGLTLTVAAGFVDKPMTVMVEAPNTYKIRLIAINVRSFMTLQTPQYVIDYV